MSSLSYERSAEALCIAGFRGAQAAFHRARSSPGMTTLIFFQRHSTVINLFFKIRDDFKDQYFKII
jgi:hypothetical protein